jgi:hypothetical protein
VTPLLSHLMRSSCLPDSQESQAATYKQQQLTQNVRIQRGLYTTCLQNQLSYQNNKRKSWGLVLQGYYHVITLQLVPDHIYKDWHADMNNHATCKLCLDCTLTTLQSQRTIKAHVFTTCSVSCNAYPLTFGNYKFLTLVSGPRTDINDQIPR